MGSELDSDPTGIGSLLTAARIESGLSLRALAERAGTSPSALSNYESGGIEPRLSTVERILAAAGMELRISYQPVDPAQDALRQWEDALPVEVIGEFRDGHRRLRESAGT